MRTLLISSVLCFATAAAPNWTRVTVQDYENSASLPSVWVVNIPNENASVRVSTEHPHDGKRCLKLHYKFVAEGQFQYLGVPNKTKIQDAVHQLRFMIFGDDSKCSYGVQVSDASGETHQYSKSTGQGGVIDFSGWKELAFDLAAGHETWGGDKNGKVDYPITAITFTVGQPTEQDKRLPAEGDLYFDSLSVDSEKSAGELPGPRVFVASPEYGSDVKGDTRVKLSARGFKSARVKCWKQGGAFGQESLVAAVALDTEGDGLFVLPADQYPHGPITVTVSAQNGAIKDNCYLQLYNKGGVSWNEGMPQAPPPAAKGMSLVFADDFVGPLSISSTDPKATYYDHKPPHGYQDFSIHVFSGRESEKNPFARVDSYLRIRASDKTKSSGLISSMKNDGSGVKVKAPCYFECRFIGPNAVGAWPGFWLMTDYMTDYKLKGDKTPCDELDIIEAYGGEGPRAPNAGDSYMVTPHCWNQGDEGKAIEKKAFDGIRNPIHMRTVGIPSTWFETFHVYGCKITETDTIYYCDDIEVGRHATPPVSKKEPHFFMINLATGGGWPVDLSRYHGTADMYIDYVRVYKQNP
jgi:Glycosyl hydrolases family 16